MTHFSKYLILTALTAVFMIISSCSKEDDADVRQPDNILGVWQVDNNTYMEFCEDNTVRDLTILYQDGESIGKWAENVYYYEPGYNLVIYVDSDRKCNVYEIVSLSASSLTWCWVEEIDVFDRDQSISHIIGDIIKEAQEGFKLDPELFQTFKKIPKDQYLDILDSLDIWYPWLGWE